MVLALPPTGLVPVEAGYATRNQRLPTYVPTGLVPVERGSFAANPASTGASPAGGDGALLIRVAGYEPHLHRDKPGGGSARIVPNSIGCFLFFPIRGFLLSVAALRAKGGASQPVRLCRITYNTNAEPTI